jgi:hypothetical protein
MNEIFLALECKKMGKHRDLHNLPLSAKAICLDIKRNKRWQNEMQIKTSEKEDTGM